MAMASPLFYQPSESRYSPSSIPLKRKPGTASPKVISIPVHFVGNSGVNPTDSAVRRIVNPTDSAVRRIQKVFRGFLVRNSVNKIVSIKNQVEEIETRIACKETVEFIRKDSKERLRINETLMALLFKLDSVRGIESGVRDLRKGVIRKAIALQEKLDALVMLPVPPQQNEASADSFKSEVVDHHPMPIHEMPMENVVDSINSQSGGQIVDHHHRICDDDEVTFENSPVLVESMDHSNCVVKEIVEECNPLNSKTQQDEDMDDCCKGEVTREDADMVSEEAQDKKSNEELQTQMIRMMRELVDKNDTQTRMINSLTHRVAQLEKAFLCDILRRSNKKKKRQHDAAAADGKQQ